MAEADHPSTHRGPKAWRADHRRSGALARVAMLPALGLLGFSATACNSSTNPTQQANQLINEGLKAQSNGHLDQAITDFKAAIVKNPANQYAYYDLGVIYERLNDTTNAINYYQKALLADPTYLPAMFNLAIVETPGDPTQAINLYSQILKVKPNDPNTLFNLGLLLIAQGQAAQGHADLKQAIALDPALASRAPKGITP